SKFKICNLKALKRSSTQRLEDSIAEVEVTPSCQEISRLKWLIFQQFTNTLPCLQWSPKPTGVSQSYRIDRCRIQAGSLCYNHCASMHFHRSTIDFPIRRRYNLVERR